MAKQNYLVDFYQPALTGDTGEDNVDAIQPVSDGEPGTATVFRRPSENLRERTELTRDFAREMAYYRDFNHLGLWGTGTFTWGGVSGTGLLTCSVGATVEIRPILTPASSTKGSLVVGSGADTITYAVASAAFITEGFDLITVEHRDSAGSPITATITPGPVRRILVVFDSTNLSHTVTAVAAAVTAAVAADTQLNLKLTVTAGAGTGVTVVYPETFIPGTADQEAHIIQGSDITALGPLADGDAVAIRYDYLVESPPSLTPGGRWQSNPERGSAAIPSSALFITSDNPEWIPGAVPLFKVQNDELVWFDGTRFPVGVSLPIGAIPASGVPVDDTVFTGADALVVNGGIDTPLSPATVQAALESIDTRLTQRRAYTYVLTDGTASEGGNFNGSSAVQDAITALSGTGGTLFLRRGSYTLPDTYAIPADVALVGEGVGLVTLTQATPTSLSLGNDVICSNISISVNTLQVAVTGTRVVLDKTNITGRLLLAGNSCVTKELRLACSADPGPTLNVTASFCTLIDTNISGTLSVGGFLNKLATTSVANGITAPTGNNVCNVSGSRNNLEGLIIGSTVALTSCGLLSIQGAYHTIANCTVIGGGTLVNCGGVVLLAPQDITLNNVSVTLVQGLPLYVVGGTTASVNDCYFANNTASVAEHVVTFLLANAQTRVAFKNSTFYQNEQTAHPLFDLAVISFPDPTASYFAFDDCKFIASRYAGFATRAVNCLFTRCEFEIRNPVDVVTGVRLLGGAADSQTSQLFVFNAGCVLTDCSVNCNDSEIREIAGQPLVDVPVYVRLGYGAVANNLTLFNVNQYIQTVLLSGVGLVELYNEVSPATYPQTSLTGLRVYFTATAAHAGAVGTKYLSNYITVTAINVAVRDFVSPTTNLPSTGISPLGSQTGVAYLQASNLQHYTDYYAPIVCPAGITVNYSSFEDCLFGRGINGCTEIVGVPLPSGVSNTFKNIDFLAYVGSNLAGGFQIPLLANDYMLNNVRLSTPSAVGTGTGLFNGVVGANYYRWIFTGCRFYLNATAAGTKNFLVDGTFNDGSVNIDLSCVGAGNVWVYSGGTAGAPSFSARINTW